MKKIRWFLFHQLLHSAGSYYCSRCNKFSDGKKMPYEL